VAKITQSTVTELLQKDQQKFFFSKYQMNAPLNAIFGKILSTNSMKSYMD